MSARRTLDYSLILTFAAKSVSEGACIEWRGGCTRTGYGQVRVSGRTLSVHRAAWIVRHGAIPPETPHVLHRCDNPPCWRDEHLFLGTPADNAHDRDSKGRGRVAQRDKTHCKWGHPFDVANTYRPARGGRQCRQCRHRRQCGGP